VKRPFVVLAMVLLACSRAAVPDEATLRAEDKHELERVIALDVRASRAMREADDATRDGDAGAAALAVTARAAPAVDEALAAAGSASLKSAWGKGKRDELTALLLDRKAAMPLYAEAVKGNDPEKMLAAIQAQAALERRALATVAAVQEGR
jgi:hypothetical protein